MSTNPKASGKCTIKFPNGDFDTDSVGYFSSGELTQLSAKKVYPEHQFSLLIVVKEGIADGTYTLPHNSIPTFIYAENPGVRFDATGGTVTISIAQNTYTLDFNVELPPKVSPMKIVGKLTVTAS